MEALLQLALHKVRYQMNHVKHPKTNFTFLAPEGMPNCDDLAVVRGTIPGGSNSPTIMSYWKPTDAELAELIVGGHIRLSIIGEGMPPVALSVVDATLTSV